MQVSHLSSQSFLVLTTSIALRIWARIPQNVPNLDLSDVFLMIKTGVTGIWKE